MAHKPPHKIEHSKIETSRVESSADNTTIEGSSVDAAQVGGSKSSGSQGGSTSRRRQPGVSLLQYEELKYPAEVSIRTLLEAGAHFGHQTDKWNPKMLPYIYCAKNGVHIINLDITLDQWKAARKVIVDITGAGGSLLFVGTKLQVRELVEHEAQRCASYYVTTRWLGGTLSNFQTIKNSIDRMRKLEDLVTQAEQENSKVRLSKKERLEITREIEKLESSLGGIRNMRRVPDVLFIVDVVKEAIAVAEAQRLKIPVIALVDTNADPECVQYPVAANDDAARTVRLLLAAAADAAIEGRRQYDARMARGADEPSTGGGGKAHNGNGVEAQDDRAEVLAPAGM